jgi:hypothetical protein
MSYGVKHKPIANDVPCRYADCVVLKGTVLSPTVSADTGSPWSEKERAVLERVVKQLAVLFAHAYSQYNMKYAHARFF